MADSVQLADLPNELLEVIFSHLPAKSAKRFTRTSKRFHAILNEQTLWRHFCLRDFRLWRDTSYSLWKDKPLAEDDWRARYEFRSFRDDISRKRFEALIVRQEGRYPVIGLIGSTSGLEAEQLLEADLQAPDGLIDTLSRRYWAERVIRHCHRRSAVDIWTKSKSLKGKANGKHMKPTEVEAAMLAFDHFMPGRPVEYKIDWSEAVTTIRQRHPRFDDHDVEHKTVVIIDYLREQQLVGGEQDVAQYHALHNNFVSHAVHGPDRSSLPLVSNVLFISLAEQLGVAAMLCSYPGHVYTAVWASWEIAEINPEQGQFYVDPWRNSEIIKPEALIENFWRESGLPVDQRAHYAVKPIEPVDVQIILARCAANMQNSVRATVNGGVNLDQRYDVSYAQYAADWCLFILGHSEHHFDRVLNMIEMLAPEDLTIADVYARDHLHYQHERKLAPPRPLGISPRDMIVRDAAEESLYYTESHIEMMEQPRRRDDAAKSVRYRVGQMFRHKRYGYTAFIVSWDPQCAQSSQWQQQMDLDSLPNGAKQPFYQSVVNDGQTERYVAQENIELITSDPPKELLDMAGQYFKRWDKHAGKFINNMLETFPDD